MVSNKLKSFTISEMMVVLVLSGIIISIALLVLSLVQNQIFDIQNNMKKKTEHRLFERVLWQDFNQNNLFFDSKKDILYCTSPSDTITFLFTENYVLRNLDTLKVKTQSKKFFLDAEQIKDNTVDAIEIIFSNNYYEKELFITKNMSATYYMNLN